MRVPRVPLLAAVAVLALVAGCTSPATTTQSTAPPTPSTDTSWAARALPSDDKHDHRDWSQHQNLSTPNFIELGHDPLTVAANGNQSAGGYFCGGSATTASGRRLSIISSYAHDSTDNVAFAIVDSTDAAHPKHVGDYLLQGTLVYDVDITPDGLHAVIAADVPLQYASGGASQASASTPAPPPAILQPGFRDCMGTVHALPPVSVPTGPSTMLISLADPTSPTLEDTFPSPVIGPHSVSTADLNGTTYVAASITNLAHHASYYQFFQLEALPSGTSKLVQLSVVDAGQYGVPTAVSNGHVDAEIEWHPILKKPVVYLSDWDGGLIVLDFSIPAAPTLLGTWADSGPDGGAMHSTRAIAGVHDGHHYLLAGQEFTGHPSNRPTGWVYILDDTDPTNVKEVGRWTLPVDTQQDWGGVELFSTHYFREQNGTVFVAMYHGGVWAFTLDYTNATAMKSPPTVGVFIPDKAPVNARKATSGYDFEPFVLDVFPFANDDLVVYDGLSGVYSLHYDAAHPMPAPPPWVVKG